jgi:hypothetical protein
MSKVKNFSKAHILSPSACLQALMLLTNCHAELGKALL